MLYITKKKKLKFYFEQINAFKVLGSSGGRAREVASHFLFISQACRGFKLFFPL